MTSEGGPGSAGNPLASARKGDDAPDPARLGCTRALPLSWVRQDPNASGLRAATTDVGCQQDIRRRTCDWRPKMTEFSRWWLDRKSYWLWRRLSHHWTCGGRWLADGGCRACDLMRHYEA